MDLFFSEGYNIDTANSVAWLKFAKCVDVNWEVPTVQEFKTIVIDEAMNHRVIEDATVSILPTLIIQTHVVGESMYAIVMAIDNDRGRYIFVGDEEFRVDDGLQFNFEKFCDHNVNIVSKKFNLRIHSIVTDYRGELITYSDQPAYIRSKSLCLLLEDLLTKHSPFTLAYPNNDESSVTRYKARVDYLKRMFVKKNTSSSEAVEEILVSVKDQIFVVNDNAETTIKAYLNALSVGCHYICHSFKGKIYLSEGMEDYANLRSELGDFYDYVVPENALCELAAYKNKSDGFEFLKENVNCFRYWELAQTEFKFLPLTATQLLSIPAIPKKINFAKFLALQNNLCEKNAFYNYRMSLLVTE